jgi:hypothetical protein
MIRRITLKFTALQWVCSSNFSFYCIVLTVSLLVLHPRHKLKYFERASWETEWITAAEEIVRAEFERSYALPAESDSVEAPPYAIEKKKVSLTCCSQGSNVISNL